PRGMVEQKDIDDQGCIYIRHGKPDDCGKEPIVNNYVLLMTLFIWWKYNAYGSQPESWYFFATSENKTVLLPAPLTLKNLEDLDQRFHFADTHSLFNLIESNREAVEQHITLETTNYYKKNEPLEFPFAIIDFKQKKEHNLLECTYGIPLKEFKPNKAEATESIEIEKSLSVFDKNWLKIDAWQHTDKFATDERNKGWKDILYLNRRQYVLDPGVYNIALQVRDPHSGKIGLYKIPFQVTDYHNDSLQLSSVILATNLSPETTQSLFAKDELQFTPKFNREFRREQPVSMYYEIYNLGYNARGQTDYEMSYAIWSYKKPEEIENPAQKPVISTAVKQSRSQRDEKVWMSFDMSDHKKGKYVIEINVRDNLTGEQVRKKIPIKVK
ncbi:hypothetical protein JXJ21_05215, partial [candidate division KSB1 bacterium]|nr:hypothetical protein [candidate division KSB1 bacterium]